MSIITSVVVFLISSALQVAVHTEAVLLGGTTVAGIAAGMLTMVVPMYLSEINLPGIQGTLVITQHSSATLGIFVSHWLEYGTHSIGGTRCAPITVYTGGTSDAPAFDPFHDVPVRECTGRTAASRRGPLALQTLPALLLGLLMAGIMTSRMLGSLVAAS